MVDEVDGTDVETYKQRVPFKQLTTVDPTVPGTEGHLLDYPEHVWEFEPDELLAMYAAYGEATYRRVGAYHFVECLR